MNMHPDMGRARVEWGWGERIHTMVSLLDGKEIKSFWENRDIPLVSLLEEKLGIPPP